MRHFCHSQHFEITGHTKPTFPKQRSCRNAKVVLASTLVTGRNSSELEVSLAARQCQRLRSTKVSIRSRSSACSRLVSTKRPHRNLTVPRIRGALMSANRHFLNVHRCPLLLPCGQIGSALEGNYGTDADRDGRWLRKLPPLGSGAPLILLVGASAFASVPRPSLPSSTANAQSHTSRRARSRHAAAMNIVRQRGQFASVGRPATCTHKCNEMSLIISTI